MNSRKYFQQPAVLGSGKSGLQIAALLANAGLCVKIYDVATPVESGAVELGISPTEAVIERLLQLEPSPLAGIEAASLILPRDYKQHWQELCEHDLIIEAYDLPQTAKQTWLTRLAPSFSRSALIVSLTQGEAISSLGAVLPAGMRPHFVGARFAKFPRLQRLVEVIPTLRSEERMVEQFVQFLQDTVGLKPYVSEDKANFLFLRLWLFFLCSAFAHSKALSSTQTEAVTALIFAHQGGIYHFLQQIGLENSCVAYQYLDAQDRQHFQSLLDWSVIPQAPLPQFSPRQLHQALPLDIQQLWARRDWEGLKAHPHPCAVFICAYLRDCWQYLAYISEHIGLSGEALDEFLYDGLGWGFMPWKLLQEFEPKKIYASTRSEQALLSYPVSAHWRRRPRLNVQQDCQSDEFTQASVLLEDNEYSRQFLYRKDMLIWQPKNSIVEVSVALLTELLNAINFARREQYALMIYHHGKQFGITRDWRQIDNHAHIEANVQRLLDCIMALRLHPRFVIFSLSGHVLDAGMALMMQADRVLAEADLTWQLTIFSQGLTGIGGIWFEWLRRLPKLSPEFSQLQTATVVEKILQDGGMYRLHHARDMGLLRSHDRYVMNRNQLASLSRKIANAWIDSDSRRAMRYPLYKLNAQALDWHKKRAEQSSDPERYLALISLLGEAHQQQVLSLRVFLASEKALFLRYLEQNSLA